MMCPVNQYKQWNNNAAIISNRKLKSYWWAEVTVNMKEAEQKKKFVSECRVKFPECQLINAAASQGQK